MQELSPGGQCTPTGECHPARSWLMLVSAAKVVGAPHPHGSTKDAWACERGGAERGPEEMACLHRRRLFLPSQDGLLRAPRQGGCHSGCAGSRRAGVRPLAQRTWPGSCGQNRTSSEAMAAAGMPAAANPSSGNRKKGTGASVVPASPSPPARRGRSCSLASTGSGCSGHRRGEGPQPVVWGNTLPLRVYGLGGGG